MLQFDLNRSIDGAARVGAHRTSMLQDADAGRPLEIDAITGAGLQLDPALVFQGSFSFDAGRQGAQQLLALTPRPTAIIASSDDIAAGVLAVAHERGMNLPADLSVTSAADTTCE